MQKTGTLIACLLLTAACSPNKFQVNKSACEVPQDVFSASHKVALEEDFNIQSRQDKQLLVSGRELDIIIKNKCEKPGKISSRITTARVAKGLRGERSYHWKLDRNVSSEEFKKWAREDECVVGVADDVVLTSLAITNDPKVASQSFLSSIKASEAWPIFYDASLGLREAVTIAVVDSGVSLTHEDIKSALWINSDEIANNGVDDDKNGYVDDVNGYNFADDDGNPTNASGKDHGTHVAGLAAAKGNNSLGVSGTMPAGAKIMALNVFGASDSTRGSSTANAVRYAADNGADVINLSLGGGFSETLRSAIVYAVQKGAIVLAAAGNSGLLLGTETSLAPAIYGAAINGLVTVGSVNSTTGAWSSFSNYSSRYVEISAPGQSGMLSTLPGNTYGYKSGTSMATPVTAGAAALAIQLIRARGFEATPARVELAIKASGIKKSGLVGRVLDSRSLNLKSLADYITTNYKSGSPAPVPLPPSTEEGEIEKVGVPCS